MKEINEDFKVPTPSKGVEQKGTTEQDEDGINKDKSDKKTIDQVLSQIYGDGQSQDVETNKIKESKTVDDILAQIYGDSKSIEVPGMSGYKEYIDEDSPVIYDIDEERKLREAGIDINLKKQRETKEKYDHISKKRGKRGVYDIEELVEVLRGERVADLVVLRIPAEYKYADYMVVGTNRNHRHVKVVAGVVLKIFKKKRLKNDPRPPSRETWDDHNIQKGWVALDLGNIVLHLFTQAERELYDLETLWTVGPQFDELSRAQELELDQANDLDGLDQLELLMAQSSSKNENIT